MCISPPFTGYRLLQMPSFLNGGMCARAHTHVDWRQLPVFHTLKDGMASVAFPGCARRLLEGSGSALTLLSLSPM